MDTLDTIIDIVALYFRYIQQAWLTILMNLAVAAVMATIVYFIFRKYNIGKYAAIITFFSRAIGMLAALALKAAMDKNPNARKVFILLVILWIMLLLYPLISGILYVTLMSEEVSSIIMIILSFVVNAAILTYAGMEVFESKKKEESK